MKAGRILRFLMNIVGGLMLLAAVGGSAQAMSPAQSLPVLAAHGSDNAVYNGTTDAAKVEKVYYRRYYRHYYYRPRYHYYHRYYYRPRYYRPFYFRRPLIVF